MVVVSAMRHFRTGLVVGLAEILLDTAAFVLSVVNLTR